MSRRFSLPYALRDELLKEMPDYLKGRLDEQQKTYESIIGVIAFFLIFILPIFLVDTPLAKWLDKNGMSFTPITVGLFAISYLLYSKLPEWLREQKLNSILLLRIKLRMWPEWERPYNTACYPTKEDIAEYISQKQGGTNH